MAFWGVEVKPGKPFTHQYDDSKGRLHISMATLGFGSATARSTLQCNVGSKSPVYLCSLYPGNTESLQLNLELEEVDRVIFTVIGPRSIHLCGYYLSSASAPNAIIDDDSESYGEDIADTDTERSDYSSDEYDHEDSFIDDDAVPKVFQHSPISSEEGASHDNRPKGGKSKLRRLRKKYQPVESDDDWVSEEKMMVSDSMSDQTKENHDEDSLAISPLYKNKACRRILDEEINGSANGGAVDASKKNGEDGGNSIIQTYLKTDYALLDSQTHRQATLSDQFVDPCTVLDVGEIKKLKKKKKGKEKGANSSFNGHSIKLENNVQDEPKKDKMTMDLLAGQEHKQEHPDDGEETEVGHGQGEKPKKKRKERPKEHSKQPTVNEDVEIADNVALPAAEGDSEKSRTKKRKKEQVKQRFTS